MRLKFVAARLAIAFGTALAALALVSAGGVGTASASSATPFVGPVPKGFVATSVTFTSANEAYVLGTAPCAHKPCGSIVRTLNRGATWVGIPAPVAAIGGLQSTRRAAWGIRFATASHGFVFGDGLWETTTGGARWTKETFPGASILSLEIIDGQVLAVTAPCTPGRCTNGNTSLYRRAVSGGGWHLIARIPGFSAFGFNSIMTYAGVAAILDGKTVLVTTNGGRTVARHAAACSPSDISGPAAVAVTGPKRLALLCAGEAAAGSVDKTAYASSDLGAHWTKAGSPPRGGDPLSIVGTTGHLVVSAASGGSFLYYSTNGAKWSTAYFAGDGGSCCSRATAARAGTGCASELAGVWTTFPESRHEIGMSCASGCEHQGSWPGWPRS